MTIDLSRLDAMPKAELVELARQVGAKHHHKAGEKTIIEAIKNHVFAPPVPTPVTDQTLQHPAQRPQKPVYFNTPDDIEKLLAPIKARSQRFETSYNTDDNTWLFQWKFENGRVGCEESGTLNQAPRIIKQKAEVIARGPLLLKTQDPNKFEPGNAIGKNAYTNVVM